MEAMGLRPKLVPGGAQNFKVTYPDDFAWPKPCCSSAGRWRSRLFRINNQIGRKPARVLRK